MTGEDLARMASHEQEQLELAARQLGFLPVDQHPAARGIDGQVVELERGLRLQPGVNAAQDGVHPGHELHR
jgi:hypothetical protein